MTSGPIWITGAAGFIGRHLARRLAASGLVVVGLGHGAWPDASRWGVSRWLNGEISADNLSQLVRDGSPPAAVFHLAGGASVGAAVAAPREDFKRTVDATSALCDWIRLEAPDARLLAVSSAAVYGAGHEGPIPETATGRPYSPYGYHKLMMEQVCRSYADTYGQRVVIARLFSVYGAGLRKQLLWDVCERLAGGARVLELGGSGEELRDWTDVTDVTRALQQLINLATPAAPTLNVGTGRALSVADVARVLTRAWGTEAAVQFSGVARKGDPSSLIADAGTLTGLDFRWQVRPEDGIAAYADWHRSQSTAR